MKRYLSLFVMLSSCSLGNMVANSQQKNKPIKHFEIVDGCTKTLVNIYRDRYDSTVWTNGVVSYKISYSDTTMRK